MYIFLPPASFLWKHPWKQTVNQPYTHNANAFNKEDMEGDNQTSILCENYFIIKDIKDQKRPIYVFIEVPKALLVHLLYSTADSCMINCL